MSVQLKGLTLYIICDECGARRPIASGYVALDKLPSRIQDIAAKIGWQDNGKRSTCADCAGTTE